MLKKKMDPVYKHSIYDSAREKVTRAVEQLEKPRQAFSNSLYTCFKCGSNNVFSVARQVRSADEGTSVFNECREFHNKWRDGWYLLCDKFAITNHKGGVPKQGHLSFQSHRTFWTPWDMKDNLKWVYLAHLKKPPHIWFSNLNLRGNSFCMYKHAYFDFFKKSLVTTNSSSVST